ncbi:MAG: PIN domain-containing protein [Actinomycetota bacterium]|nr:PIN domain-containing protein [Actinomycetota bacterium]
MKERVTVLDACAVLALLTAQAAAVEIRRLLEGGEATLTALGVAEVVDHLVRRVGASDEDAALDIAALGLADPHPLDAELAMRAGLLRSSHYHRRSRAVGLADCVVAETARRIGSPAATSDPHLLDMCRDEGIEVVALRDTRGNSWSP